MNDLEKCRRQIDEIDSQIIALYEQRMNIIKEVSLYKKEHNIPVLDSSREAVMLNKNLAKLSKEEFKEYYHFVLEGFLSASKSMQKKLLK